MNHTPLVTKGELYHLEAKPWAVLVDLSDPLERATSQADFRQAEWLELTEYYILPSSAQAISDPSTAQGVGGGGGGWYDPPCRFAPDWARASQKKRADSSPRDEEIDV